MVYTAFNFLAVKPLSTSVIKRHQLSASSTEKKFSQDAKISSKRDPFSIASPSALPRLPSKAPLRAPREFIRLRPNGDNGLLLQTAVTTYISRDTHEIENERTRQRVDIYSLLHFADINYYQHIQNALLKMTSANNHAVVLFEMLTSSRNVTQHPYPRLKTRTQATVTARTSALKLGAVAQADILDLTLPQWRIADLRTDDIPNMKNNNVKLQNELSLFPLLRLIAACLPCPELHAVLLDMVSGRAHFSLRALLALLTRGYGLTDARRIAFAGRISRTRAERKAQSKLGRARNVVAWDAFRETLKQNHVHHVAILYGAWHSAPLCRCAEQDGWKYHKTSWHTAMHIKAPALKSWNIFPIVSCLIAYIVYAAFDWVALIDVIAESFENYHFQMNGHVAVLMYFVRHWAPYLVFRRWFSAWDEL